MKEFVRRHEARIHGVLSCFDRMLFRGYLPIMSGWSMAQFLKGQQLSFLSSEMIGLVPLFAGPDHRVEDGQELSHTGDQRDLRPFPTNYELVVEG